MNGRLGFWFGGVRFSVRGLVDFGRVFEVVVMRQFGGGGGCRGILIIITMQFGGGVAREDVELREMGPGLCPDGSVGEEIMVWKLHQVNVVGVHC